MLVHGPAIGDAFGELLQEAYAGDGRAGRVLEVVERDDGHVRVNDAARYLAPSWGPLDDWVYERARGDVLDLGCGAGRNALVLQERGLDVVGVDPSPGAVDVCRRRGVRELVTGTADDVQMPGRFTTVLMLGNNLGLLGSRDAAGPLLARLAELTGPAGQVLATGVGREPGSTADACDRAYEQANIARGRLPWQVTMRSRFRDLATEWFDYAFLRVQDLVDLVEPSPWRVVEHLAQGPQYVVRLQKRG